MNDVLDVCKEAMEDLPLDSKLIVISNLIFDLYPELYEEDARKGVKPPLLQTLADYNELVAIYDTAERRNTHVWKALDAAHTLLLIP